MNLTDFLIMNGNGEEVPVDAFGSNVVFACTECRHPVLASAIENQPGSDEEHLSRCKRCGRGYFLDVRPHAVKLYIHDVSNAKA